jgi:Zn-finger nucleic acid-binding protein
MSGQTLKSVLVPNCVNCGAPMRPAEGGMLACDHCGSMGERAVSFDLETLGESSRACPHCAKPLLDARLERCPVQYCGSCQGVLVEMRNFVTLTDAVRARAPRAGSVPPRVQQPGDRTLSCPACGQPMLSHLYGGPGNIVLDTCEACQVNWLDPGELQRIARAP